MRGVLVGGSPADSTTVLSLQVWNLCLCVYLFLWLGFNALGVIIQRVLYLWTSVVIMICTYEKKQVDKQLLYIYTAWPKKALSKQVGTVHCIITAAINMFLPEFSINDFFSDIFHDDTGTNCERVGRGAWDIILTHGLTTTLTWVRITGMCSRWLYVRVCCQSIYLFRQRGCEWVVQVLWR